MTRLWPEGEQVEAWGGEGTPDGFVWHGEPHRILDVCNCWRIHTRWWEPDQGVRREYLKVVTDTGLLCYIYRDLLSGDWFLSKIYD